MNSVWEPKSLSDVDCDSNQTEVVLLIWIGTFSSFHSFKHQLDPFIRQNNHKIILLYHVSLKYKYNGIFDRDTFLLIKKQLQANQKVKIVFYKNIRNTEGCSDILEIMRQLKLIHLPYSRESLGLVLFQPNNLDKRDPKFDIGSLPQHHLFYLRNETAWDRCVDFGYGLLKCEKYGCPALKVLTNKDTGNQFTNILLVKMTKRGQLIAAKAKLETFINDRLQFTNLTEQDIQIFQPETYNNLQHFHGQQQELVVQRMKELFGGIVLEFSGFNSTSFLSVADIHKLEQSFSAQSWFVGHNFFKSRSSQRLVGVDTLFVKMLFLVNSLIMRSDPHSVRISSAMLTLLNRMDSAFDKNWKHSTCHQKPAKLKDEPIAAGSAQNEVLFESFESFHEKLKADESFLAALKNTNRKLHEKANYHARKLVRVDCEKVLQAFLAEFTKDWYVQTENIETAVDRLTKKLTLWADRVPIYENEIITWDNFSKWIGVDLILLAGINSNVTGMLFGFSQRRDVLFQRSDQELIDPDFQWMIRGLLHTFNNYVTTVAIQRLATSKLERVDDIIAELDRRFMAGIRNLHQSIDCELWLIIRPQIFYYLVRLQQDEKTFDNFLTVVKIMFDIHHIEMPMAPYERLQKVKAEFDVYQQQMGGYINGTINTTQQWGRKFHETTEYMIRNSGTQQKSFINGAVKWIKDELMYEREPTRSGFDLDGTLVFVNLIIRKCFKGRRNLW
jgi:hypothetical protein